MKNLKGVELLTNATIEYLLMQIKSGADVIKFFDSWAGALNADMVLRYSLNPIKKIVSDKTPISKYTSDSVSEIS